MLGLLTGLGLVSALLGALLPDVYAALALGHSARLPVPPVEFFYFGAKALVPALAELLFVLLA